MRRFVIWVAVISVLGLGAASVGAVDEVKKTDQKPAAEKKADKPAEKKADKKEPAKSEPAKPAVRRKKAKQAASEAEAAKTKKEEAKPAEAAKGAEAKTEKVTDLAAIAKRIAGIETPPAKKSGKEKKKATVVQFTLRGELAEGATAAGMFGEMAPSLTTLLERLQAAADDKDVAAVVIRVEDLEIGRGKVHELRAAIARLKAAKKPVYAELASGDAKEYLVASACSEVIMPASGMLIMPGVRAEMTFFKGLFDKLGLQFDVLQQGKYKGAGEPFSRSSMSPALRESMTALVDDTYDDLAKTIGADRNLADYRVKTLFDEALFTARSAKAAGLIDTIAYSDEIEARLKRNLKVDELNVVTDYKKKKIEADFSGLGGMVKMMELMFGGKPSEHKSDKAKIAVVYAVGPITEGKSESDMWGSRSVGSSTLTGVLRKAAEDATVKAVVLRIDSPGGSAVASDLIWREIVRMKKPVVASMSDVAGSGGYYIAMGAKKIFAEPGTLTGSIGVIGGKLVTGKLMNKLGVNTEVIARGKLSGALSSDKPFSAEERAAWTKLLEETYAQFVRKAADGRKMPVKKLEELAQGRVYSGRMAAQNGLVDRIGTLADAVAEAKRLAGVKPDDKIEVQTLPAARSIFEQLFGDASLSSELEGVLPSGGKMLLEARFWKRLFTEPSLVLMPCQVELK